MGKFEKVDSKIFLRSLLKDLLMKDLVTLGNLLSTKFWNLVDDFMQFQAGKHGCHTISRTK
jgi:hypothetical protein